MNRMIATVCATVFLAGCAASPESIAPSYVSPLTYRSFNCADLATEQARVEQALTEASAQQTQAHGNDVVGVLLIGVPVSTLSGTNVAPQVADLKGRRDALIAAARQKRCKA